MRLSLKVNYILFPVIIIIFSLAGVYFYYSQKSMLIDSVEGKLKSDSEYIIRDLEKNILELEGLTELFLNSSEVTQLVNNSESNLSVMIVEAQLFRYIDGFKTSFGEVKDFNLLNQNKNSIFYFHVTEPFAEFSLSENVIKHIDNINEKMKAKGAIELKHTSYELLSAGNKKVSLNIFRTFSPDIPITENRFPNNIRTFTAVIESVIDIDGKYLNLLKNNFSENVELEILSDKPVSQLGYGINHNIDFSDEQLTIISDNNFLSVSIKLPEDYMGSVMMPYRNTIASVVINISIITFILLKLLIQRQIIRPIVSLTEQVEDAISGDYNLLSKIDRGDEVVSLNNNYMDLFDELNKMAKYDHLTGLTNRKFFNKSILHSIEHSKRYRTQSALLYIDLDNFKQVNDTYGHHIGDLVLQSFSRQLEDCLREEELLIKRNTDYDIARLAGDEFAVILMGMPNIDAIAHAARRITNICRNGFNLDGANYDIRVSIGISVCPDDATTSESLLLRADSAMYQVKKTGKNGFHFYSEALDSELKRHALIEDELKRALKQEDFYLVFMPVFDCRNGSLVGAEALLRSDSQLLSAVGPAEFIPVAEGSDLIRDIDYWVIESAIKKLKILIDDYQFDGIISVNFSSWQLRNKDFARDVSQLIDKYMVPANQLELEITETHLVIDDKDNIDILKELKSLGVYLALDDFGTGYTAFRQLINYPVDTLKIDRSFVGALNQNNRDEKSLVDIIVELAALYKLNVIAEGIEEQYHFDYVRKIGCDKAQGYFLSKPINWEEFTRLYKEYLPETRVVGERSEHEFIFRSLTGSVSINTESNIIIIDYRGLITADLIRYVINSIEMCVAHLNQEKWGALVISDDVYDFTEEVAQNIGLLVDVCVENGCVESAYVIKKAETLKQIGHFRQNSGLRNDLQEKVFRSAEEGKAFLSHRLNEFGERTAL